MGNRLARHYAEQNQMPIAAGSDSHFAEDVGIVGVKIDTELETEKVLEKIKKGKASIFGRTLSFRTYVRRAIYKASDYM